MHLVEAALPRRTAIALALLVGVTAWRAHSLDAPRPHVVVTDTETTILDVVRFEPGTATLCTSSRPILDAVADTLRGNPGIELVEVQSHTSGIGDASANQTLSEQRAAVVVAYLVHAGIAPSRLVAEGYGDTQPIDRAAPTKNERVSFLILQRSSDGS
jgi:outer membrane protein OmpA-like peptidoglycan-associated protein